MKHNHFTAPNANSVRSAHEIVVMATTVKPTKRVGWEMQKNIPADVKRSIEIERAERQAKGFIY